MNAPDKCPHCGSRFTGKTNMAVRYLCGWTIYDPSTNQTMWVRPYGCIEAERDQLATRLTELSNELEAVAPLIASALGRLRFEVTADASILPTIEAIRSKVKGSP